MTENNFATPFVSSAINPMASLPNPPTYDGTRSAELLDGFVNTVRLHCEVRNLRDQERTVFAGLFLVGRAASWFNRTISFESAPGWDEFVRLLKSEFYPAGYGNGVQRRWDALRHTGNVRSYNAKFHELASKLPRGYVSEEAMLFKYLKGLDKQVELQVRLKQPTSLGEAMQIAQVMDDMYYTFGTARPSTSSTGFSDGIVPMEVDAISIKKLTPEERERLKRLGLCFRCRTGKHFARDCPRFSESSKNLGRHY